MCFSTHIFISHQIFSIFIAWSCIKVPLDAIQDDLEELGLTREIIEKLTSVLTNNSIEDIEAVLGENSEAVKELKELFKLCEAYGIQDWILFDASVVRGLAYYTGIVFEAFDRKGVLRAIAGGGRYDKLLETFGGDPTPAAGFGFGDAVIVELLKERDVLPSFESSDVDTVVFAMSPELYPAAIQAACGRESRPPCCEHTKTPSQRDTKSGLLLLV